MITENSPESTPIPSKFENKKFFDKHPKQKSGIKITFADAKGNKIEL